NVLKPRAIISRQARHVTQLVDELLDVGRIACGKVELNRQVLPFQDVVQFAIDSSRSSLESANIELHLDIADTPVPICGDSKRLRQVVLNLLTNAQKFTPAGGRIEVRLAAEGDDAVLRVRDSGIGIDADTLPRIFDLFVQGEGSVQRGSSGL